VLDISCLGCKRSRVQISAARPNSSKTYKLLTLRELPFGVQLASNLPIFGRHRAGCSAGAPVFSLYPVSQFSKYSELDHPEAGFGGTKARVFATISLRLGATGERRSARRSRPPGPGGVGPGALNVNRLYPRPHRYFGILGHATGRLLLKRTGYKLDFANVVGHARDTGCFFEINSRPRPAGSVG
jgi:hypothetical protein